MIPVAHIRAWRSTAPWPMDEQVEQDLIISRAMVEIFSEPALRDALACRGGTALGKLYLPSTRYSEDIDLVQTQEGPIGPIADALRVRLDWLGQAKYQVHEGRYILRFRTEAESQPGVPLRLKIEINTREHFTTHGLVTRHFSVANPWFDGSADVVTFSLEELLATKFRALYQRRKGRDLYDLWFSLAEGGANPEVIVSSFKQYMEAGGTPVSRAEYEANMHDKLRHPGFGQDIRPLLVTGVTYDQAAAAALVHHELIARLDGEPWKGPGKQQGRRQQA